MAVAKCVEIFLFLRKLHSASNTGASTQGKALAISELICFSDTRSAISAKPCSPNDDQVIFDFSFDK